MDWINQPEIRRSVDAVLLDPLDDERIRTLFLETLGTLTNVFVPSAGSSSGDIMSDYLSNLNQGRPYILVGSQASLACTEDLLVAFYGPDMMADVEAIREDARARIASFIGTRTYCLRERVEQE